MVVCGGVRNVIAWQIRSYIDCNDIVILRVYYIPSPQIVSLSPSIDVLSIYIVTSFVRVGVIGCITLYYPPPLPLFPVTFIIPLPCRVPFPVISVKFLT